MFCFNKYALILSTLLHTVLSIDPPDFKADSERVKVNENFHEDFDFEPSSDSVFPFIIGMFSQHDNTAEDRKFEFDVGSVNGLTCEPNFFSSFTHVHDFVNFRCPANQALAAVSSRWIDGENDRLWRFKCCEIGNPDQDGDRYEIESVLDSNFVNFYDGEVSFACNKNEVMVGVFAQYSSPHRDRRWGVLCGLVTPKLDRDELRLNPVARTRGRFLRGSGGGVPGIDITTTTFTPCCGPVASGFFDVESVEECEAYCLAHPDCTTWQTLARDPSTIRCALSSHPNPKTLSSDTGTVVGYVKSRGLTGGQPRLTQLTDMAVDGFSDLPMCHGDCDSDSDCAAGLKCFQRTGYSKVPGCAGVGTEDWDYCYDPAGSIPISGDNDPEATNLQACTGECDSDRQCAQGLVCFQRDDGETIPGCLNNGEPGDLDYCFDPSFVPGGCEIKVGEDIDGGFVPHPNNGATGHTDSSCQNLCNVSSGCTAWVRRPSDGQCYLSVQTGEIRFKDASDRNAGLRCEPAGNHRAGEANFVLRPDADNFLRYGDQYVCDDFFEEDEARMVCRQLGEQLAWYRTAIDTPGGSTNFGIDDLDCSQGANNLGECSYVDDAHNCDSGEAVKIGCTGYANEYDGAFDFNPVGTPIIIEIGPHHFPENGRGPVKTVKGAGNGGLRCPRFVNKNNWVGKDVFPDEFDVRVVPDDEGGQSVEVTRLDAPGSGWGMYLAIGCYEANTHTIIAGIKARKSSEFFHDREFEFYTTSVPGLNCAPDEGFSEYQNNFHQNLDFDCPPEQVLSGFSSFHDNIEEDRRFRFRCCDVRSAEYNVGEVREVAATPHSEYEHEIDNQCAHNEAMVGVRSVWNDDAQSRSWTLKCGLLRKPEEFDDCVKIEILSVEVVEVPRFGLEAVEEIEPKVTSASGTVNNCNEPSVGGTVTISTEATQEISQSETITLETAWEDTYSFSSTSSFEFTYSQSFKTGVERGVSATTEHGVEFGFGVSTTEENGWSMSGTDTTATETIRVMTTTSGTEVEHEPQPWTKFSVVGTYSTREVEARVVMDTKCTRRDGTAAFAQVRGSYISSEITEINIKLQDRTNSCPQSYYSNCECVKRQETNTGLTSDFIGNNNNCQIHPAMPAATGCYTYKGPHSKTCGNEKGLGTATPPINGIPGCIDGPGANCPASFGFLDHGVDGNRFEWSHKACGNEQFPPEPVSIPDGVDKVQTGQHCIRSLLANEDFTPLQADTLFEAILKCENNPDCTGIMDTDCNERGPFLLCGQGSRGTSASTCIYELEEPELLSELQFVTSFAVGVEAAVLEPTSETPTSDLSSLSEQELKELFGDDAILVTAAREHGEIRRRFERLMRSEQTDL